MERFCVMFVLLLFCMTVLAGADELVQEGSRIRVKGGREVRATGGENVLPSGDWVRGKYLGTDASVLIMETEERHQLRLQRDSVERLQVSLGRSRGKAALIGAGVGAGVGVLFGAIMTSNCNAKGGWFCGLEYLVTVITIPAGAALGLAVGMEKWGDVPMDQVHGSRTPGGPSAQLIYRWE